MKKTLSVIVLTAIAAIFSALVPTAAAAEDDYESWVQQISSDVSGSAWGAWSCNGGTRWSDGIKPSEGKNYHVPVGITNGVPDLTNSRYDFNGDVLAVSGAFRAMGQKPYYINELRLLGGSVLEQVNYVGTINPLKDGAKLTCHGTMENPAAVRLVTFFSYKPTFAIGLPLASDKDGCLCLETATSASDGMTRSFPCDNSGFLGTLVFSDIARTKYSGAEFATVPGTLAFPCAPSNMTLPTEFAGTIAASDGWTLDSATFGAAAGGYGAIRNGTLRLSSGDAIGTVRIDEGSTLSIAPETVVTVTKSLDLASGAIVSVEDWGALSFTNEERKVALFNLTGEAASTFSGSLSDVIVKGGYGIVPRGLRLGVSDDVGGGKTVSLVWDKLVVALVKQPPSSDVSFLSDGSYWSDGKAPHDSADYCLTGFEVFTWSGDSVFAGDSLMVGMPYYAGPSRYRGGDFHFVEKMDLNTYGSVESYDANVYFDADMTFSLSRSVSLYYNREICGTGSVTFTSRPWNNTPNPWGIVELRSLNTNFHGRIVLTTPYIAAMSGRVATPDIANGCYNRLVVTNGWSIGGSYQGAGNGYDAVTIANESLLECRSSLSFDEPSRGFLISIMGRVSVVADASATFNGSITYAGKFRKEGPGTLVLGGEARFMDGQPTTEPQAGSNVLEVVGGWLLPKAAAATDGVVVSFAEGAGLALDGTLVGGLRSVRNGSSVSIGTDSGRLPVCLTAVNLPQNGGTLTIDLATFKERGAATAFGAACDLPNKFGSFRLDGPPVTVGADGLFVVQASYSRKGAIIVVR